MQVKTRNTRPSFAALTAKMFLRFLLLMLLFTCIFYCHSNAQEIEETTTAEKPEIKNYSWIITTVTSSTASVIICILIILACCWCCCRSINTSENKTVVITSQPQPQPIQVSRVILQTNETTQMRY